MIPFPQHFRMIEVRNIGDSDFKRVSLELLLLLSVVTNVTCTQNDKPIALNIGDPAPSLRVGAWMKGAPIKRLEKGQVYVLEFWATWCKPCKEMFPKLRKLHESKRSEGLEVIALTRHYMAFRGPAESMIAERQLMLDMVTEYGVNFHVGIAEDERLQGVYGANGLPTVLLIDRSGIIRYAGPGEDDMTFNKQLQQCLEHPA